VAVQAHLQEESSNRRNYQIVKKSSTPNLATCQTLIKKKSLFCSIIVDSPTRNIPSAKNNHSQ
jgi:hypothetical protein